MNRLRSGILSLILLTFEFSVAQTNLFNSNPDWVSNSLGHYATGLGVADINQDGWDDIIVANGNDMARQSLVVYYNNGNGSFPVSPSWSSSDIDYLGHLSIGDINGDNLPDVAVSVFLGPARFAEQGYAKVYFNQGTELELTPSYQTADSMYTFSCALGDADGDGDLDLATACGEPYGNITSQGKIYYNFNGVLDTLPGWQSLVVMGALDVEFADFDNNGFFDIAFASHITPNYIFLADNMGNIATTPAWFSQDDNYFANSLTIAKVDSNEFPDLIISDNNQLGGHGKYKMYAFDTIPQGQLGPSWLSNTGGYGSAVLAEDLNFDGHPDLLAGRWWGRVELYSGISNSFVNSPSWSSFTNSVIEAFVLKDVDRDGIEIKIDTIIVSQDSAHIFYLSEMSVEKILSVRLNGQILIPGDDYFNIPGRDWISTKPTLFSGDYIVVEYEFSKDRDLLVSNWDPDVGNYLFYNQSNPTSIIQKIDYASEITITYSPNPFNQSCRIEIYTPVNTNLKIEIYDINGRLVNNFINGNINKGINKFLWSGKNNNGEHVSTGTYFTKINLDNQTYTGKLLILR